MPKEITVNVKSKNKKKKKKEASQTTRPTRSTCCALTPFFALLGRDLYFVLFQLLSTYSKIVQIARHYVESGLPPFWESTSPLEIHPYERLLRAVWSESTCPSHPQTPAHARFSRRPSALGNSPHVYFLAHRLIFCDVRPFAITFLLHRLVLVLILSFSSCSSFSSFSSFLKLLFRWSLSFRCPSFDGPCSICNGQAHDSHRPAPDLPLVKCFLGTTRYYLYFCCVVLLFVQLVPSFVSIFYLPFQFVV